MVQKHFQAKHDNFSAYANAFSDKARFRISVKLLPRVFLEPLLPHLPCWSSI